MATQPVNDERLRLTRIAVLQRERERLQSEYRQQCEAIDAQIRKLSGSQDAKAADKWDV